MTMTQEECVRHVKNSLVTIGQDIAVANSKINTLLPLPRDLAWVDLITDALFDLRSSLDMMRIFQELDAGTRPMPWLKSKPQPELNISLADLDL